MNNLIVFMSITGSIPMVIYFLLRGIYKEQISAHLYKILLYISMAFYLIPFPLLSNALRNFFSKLIYKKSYLDNLPIIEYFDVDKTFIKFNNKIFFPDYSTLFFYFSQSGY